ncbi:MAG: amidohydrolase [Clostridia bacterium]|nr:dihydroorotase family protein [Lachnospiraceae bacterium]NCC00412.1 amidohydrolase [Clostridia bacterium]NCD02611.1 amidohydrolase [Clostridia bacterium]
MDTLDMLIVNGTIVTDKESFPGTIGIKDGRIAAVCGPGVYPEALETVDVRGNYILPGAIDPHVHFQDPGFTEREDFKHGTMAAAAGGMTCVLSHPLDNPPTTTFENLKVKEDAYEGKAFVDYGIHIGATSDNLEVLGALWNETGATSVKMFMCFSVKEFPFVEDEAMLKALKIVAENNAVAIIHAENDGILSMMTKEMHEAGRKDGVAYNLSHPAEAEIEAIKRALYFLEITGATGVILHVSTAQGLELIHAAKEKGVKVYAESAPHLFQFTVDDMVEKGPYLKFSPVMHDKENQKKMWELIQKGYVDYIGSDHSPYTKEEKQVGEDDIWKAPNGIPGIETSLAVFLNGVNEGKLTLNQVAKMTSKNTARIYGLSPDKGTITPGTDADFTIVDMNLKKSIKSEELKSKCKWSPYEGVELKGWPVMTIVRGKVVYDHGKIAGEAGYGKYVQRKK